MFSGFANLQDGRDAASHPRRKPVEALSPNFSRSVSVRFDSGYVRTPNTCGLCATDTRLYLGENGGGCGCGGAGGARARVSAQVQGGGPFSREMSHIVDGISSWGNVIPAAMQLLGHDHSPQSAHTTRSTRVRPATIGMVQSTLGGDASSARDAFANIAVIPTTASTRGDTDRGHGEDTAIPAIAASRRDIVAARSSVTSSAGAGSTRSGLAQPSTNAQSIQTLRRIAPLPFTLGR